MSSPRTPFLTYISEQFKDEKIKNTCLDSCKSNLENNVCNRIFDNFPTLTTENEMNDLVNQFEAILKNPSMKALETWQKAILKNAMFDLIEKNGKVKPEIIKVFELQNYTKKLDGREIISAYVGAINMLVLNQLSHQLESYSSTFLVVCDAVNKNISDWIIEAANEEKYSLNSHAKDIWLNVKFMRAPSKKQTGFFTVAGMALATAAYFAWNHFTSKKTDESSESSESKIDDSFNTKPLSSTNSAKKP